MIAIGETRYKGRGVFAQTKIPADVLIEEGPVVIVPPEQIEHLNRTTLANYYFLWGPDETEAALLLARCSLCNHSFDPNAIFVLNPERLTISFFSRRDIPAGEEITINYNGDPAARTPIWFRTAP
jgi:SET domain-containing protein